MITSSISVTRDLSSVTNESLFSHTYKPSEIKHVVWDAGDTTRYRAETDIALKSMEIAFNSPEFVPLKCELYSRLLVNCAEKTFKVKQTQTSKSKSIKFSKQQNQAWTQFDKSFKMWARAGKPRNESSQLFKQFKLARSNYQRVRRYEDNLKNIKHNNLLMTYHKEDKTKLYSVVRAARGKGAS